MKECNDCGANNKKSAEYCGECGSKLKGHNLNSEDHSEIVSAHSGSSSEKNQAREETGIFDSEYISSIRESTETEEEYEKSKPDETQLINIDEVEDTTVWTEEDDLESRGDEDEVDELPEEISKKFINPGELSLKDIEESLEKYEEAQAFFYGNDRGRDRIEALSILKKTVKNDHLPSLVLLGILYVKGGDDLEPNYRKGVNYLTKAAEAGYADAQNELGICYQQGLGSIFEPAKKIEADKGKARTWYRKSARQGHPKAQCNLAQLYANGEGVQQNLQEAKKWAKKSADQGLAVGEALYKQIQQLECEKQTNSNQQSSCSGFFITAVVMIILTVFSGGMFLPFCVGYYIFMISQEN